MVHNVNTFIANTNFNRYRRVTINGTSFPSLKNLVAIVFAPPLFQAKTKCMKTYEIYNYWLTKFKGNKAYTHVIALDELRYKNFEGQKWKNKLLQNLAAREKSKIISIKDKTITTKRTLHFLLALLTQFSARLNGSHTPVVTIRQSLSTWSLNSLEHF